MAGSLVAAPGDLDSSFTPVTSQAINSVALQADGKIIFGTTKGQFGRLNADGTIDETFVGTFNPTTDFGSSPDSPNSIAIQQDGKILVAGDFNRVDEENRSGFARLKSSGALDTNFNPAIAGGRVRVMALQPDGSLVIGGDFLGVNYNLYYKRIARLTSYGTADQLFEVTVNDQVTALTVQEDGKILVGGKFTEVNGVARTGLVRLKKDGKLDTTFLSTLTGDIQSLVVQPDGKILVAGALGGGAITRLLPDGTEDTAFRTNTGLAPETVGGSVSLQCDGAVLVTLRENAEGSALGKLLRLQPDGAPDATFTANWDTAIRSIALRGDGQILVARNSSTSTSGTELVRLENSAATESLTIQNGKATWLRGGSAPELGWATFDLSSTGAVWELAPGQRVAGGWERAAIPSSAWVRTSGLVSSGSRGTSGLVGKFNGNQDHTTQRPAISAPSSNSNQPLNGPFLLYFWLSESALPGSVKVAFEDQQTDAVVAEWTLGASVETNGSHAILVNPLDPLASSREWIVSGTPLVAGTYRLRLSYRDLAGNPVASSTASELTFAQKAPVARRVSLSPRWAKAGSVVTLKIETDSMYLAKVNGTIAGQTVGGLTINNGGKPILPRYEVSMAVVVPENTPEGPLQFSVTLEDQAGNSGPAITATTDGSLTVVDRTPPVITNLQDKNFETLSSGGVYFYYWPTVTDNLDPEAWALFTPNQIRFNIGTSEVTVTAEDSAGNKTVGIFKVTVADTKPPTFLGVPDSLTLQAGASGTVQMPWVFMNPSRYINPFPTNTLPVPPAASSDVPEAMGSSVIVIGNPNPPLPPARPYETVQVFDASTVSRSQSPSQGELLTAGTYVLKIEATDQWGNHAIAESTVTVLPLPGTTPDPGSNPDPGPDPEPGTGVTLASLATAGPAGLGQPVPGAGVIAGIDAGSTLAAFFAPALSDDYELAARVTFQDAQQRNKRAAIYFQTGAGVRSLVAFQGGFAPNSAGLFPGQTFKSFLDPVLSPSGAIAFAAKVQGGGVKTTTDDGVWTNAFTPELIQVLEEGAQVPGLPEGGLLKSVTSLSLRDGELVALVTLVSGKGGVKASNDTALIRLTGVGEAELLVREGVSSAGGMTVLSFSVFNPASLSPGQGRWHGADTVITKLSVGAATFLARSPAGGGVELLAQAPGRIVDIVGGATLAKFTLPGQGGATGGYAMQGTLKLEPGSVTTKNDTVLRYSADGQTWELLAREGTLAADAGGAAWSTFFDPVVNAQGQTAFLGTLAGGGVKATQKTALWSGTPGDLKVVARLGLAAPDVNGDADSTRPVFSKFLSYALPDGANAGAIFLAEVSGPGVSAKGKLGLWAADASGKVRELLRTDWDITVAPGDARTLTGFTLLQAVPGSYGVARSYNAEGSIVVLATFKDKSQALLRIGLPAAAVK